MYRKILIGVFAIALALGVAMRAESAATRVLLSGTPTTVVSAKTRYSFSPSSYVQSDEGFRFEIANKPAWATFDPIWGRLSGLPTEQDIGETRDVSISLVSGDQRATLPPFTIKVAAPVAGVAAKPPRFVTLRWVPPSDNVDGTPLTDLAGYVLLLGSSPGDLRPLRTLDAQASPMAVLSDLPHGYNFISIRSYNRAGRTGPPSAIVGVWIAPDT